jgi:hypothetical protein
MRLARIPAVIDSNRIVMSYSKIIIILSHIPIVAAALVAGWQYKKLQPTGKAFAWFVLYSCLIQLVALGYWFMRRNNMPLLHLYVPTGFALLAIFYGKLLAGYVNGMIIRLTLIGFVAFSLVNSLFFQPITTFNSYALTAEAILLLILSIFTFIVQLNRAALPVQKSQWTGVNPINSGLFIYYASTLLLFFFGSSIMRSYSVDLSAYTWIYHSFFSIILYICFIVGLWKQAAAYR